MGCLRMSYTSGVPEERYIFEELTFQRLAEAEIGPLSVTDVLYGQQIVRRHIGATLQVAGYDRFGTWLAVALIEHDDDEYRVTSARYLDDAEIQAVARMRGDRT